MAFLSFLRSCLVWSVLIVVGYSVVLGRLSCGGLAALRRRPPSAGGLGARPPARPPLPLRPRLGAPRPRVPRLPLRCVSAAAAGGLGCRCLGVPRPPGPRLAGGLGQLLPAGLPLLDQGRDPVGQVAGQGLEESGHLLHRRRQGAGDAGQEHVAGGQVGQGRQVRGREQRAVGQAALDDQERVGPGEVLQRLGHRADVALHEGQRLGPLRYSDRGWYSPPSMARRTRVFLKIR